LYRLPWKRICPAMVFAGQRSSTIAPDAKDVAGFAEFMERYKKGLAIEKAAVKNLKS
jgi:hypothetical protein